MPHYYFHIRNGDTLIPDDEGLELDCVDDAVSEAKASAIDLLQDALATGDQIRHQVIEVRDEHGRVVERVAISETRR